MLSDLETRQRRARPACWSGDWYVAVAFVCLWAATLTPLLSVAAANDRLVQAFSTDEALQTNLIARALQEHAWGFQFGAYGHFYLNLALLPLKAFWPVTTRTIVVTMRALSLAAAVGLLLFAFGWARRVYGSIVGWLALLLIALNPTVYTWTVVVHPDMLQALCLLVALFSTVAAVERPTTARIAAASVCAGLAFATKYSGMFVLPLIAAAAFGRRHVAGGRGAGRRTAIVRGLTALAAAAMLLCGFAIDGAWIVAHISADGHVDVPLPVSLDTAVSILRGAGAALAVVAAAPRLWSAFRRSERTETVAWGIGVSLVAFSLTFVFASPYSLAKLAFVKGLYYEAVETGARLNAHWVETWTTGVFSTMGWPIAFAIGATVLGWLVDRRRHTPVEHVLGAWNVLYVLVLLAPFHELALHYALAIVAPVAILAARAVVAVPEALAWRAPRVRRVVAAVAVTALAASQLASIGGLSRARRSVLEREQSPIAVAGGWLAEHVPTESKIVYDYTSYVPPTFTNTTATWGETRQWLARLDPDVVVVNRASSRQWRGPNDEPSYAACLDQNTCGYATVFTIESIAIFQKRAPAASAAPSLGALH